MAMKMNKTKFISELSKRLSYEEEKCIIINDILENHFFLSKKNKDKIIEALMEQLEIDKDEATIIYETAVKIVNEEIKNKLKHPFGSNQEN